MALECEKKEELGETCILHSTMTITYCAPCRKRAWKYVQKMEGEEELDRMGARADAKPSPEEYNERHW